VTVQELLMENELMVDGAADDSQLSTINTASCQGFPALNRPLNRGSANFDKVVD